MADSRMMQAAVVAVALTVNGQPISRAGDVDAVPILRAYTYFPDGRVLERSENGFTLWWPAPGVPGLLFTF